MIPVWKVPSIFSNQHSIARYHHPYPPPLPFSWLFVLGGSHGGCKGVAGVGVYGGGMRHSRHSAATPRRHIALLSTPVTLPPLHSSIMNVFIPKRSSFCLFQAKPVLPSLPATNQFVFPIFLRTSLMIPLICLVNPVWKLFMYESVRIC